MFHQLRANPLAASALAVALIGTSIAIGGLPHNSVGSKQIKKGGVHRSDLFAHAVSRSKLAKNALPAKGATGAQGPAGAVGPAGPTEGFASSASFTGAIPSNTPEQALASTQITTTTAGRIFGFGRGTYSGTCQVASAIGVGLYLDGVPLIASGSPLSSTKTELNLFGATAAAVASGTHTLALRADCATSDVATTSSEGDVALGAFVLGK